MTSIFIYALIDPNGWVRYIGQSAHPKQRLSNHVKAGSGLVQAWVFDLAKGGAEPRLFLLEECDSVFADRQERLWIQRFELAGAPLLNKETQAAYPAEFRKEQRVRPSVGARMFAEACAERGRQQAVSRSLGIRAGVSSRWMSGKTRPVTKYRIELEKLLGIPMQAWDQEPAAAGEKASDAA